MKNLIHRAGIAVQCAGYVALGWAFFSLSAAGQNSDAGKITCSSTDGRRTFCQADTSRGVRRVRQVGDVRCVEGYSWGFDQKGVWVDHGCRAEFALPAERRALNQRTTIDAGTMITVRTDGEIDADIADGKIYSGSVDQDVMGTDGKLAIPRGSSVELIARVLSKDEMSIDLESVVVQGQRYAIKTDEQTVTTDRKEGIGANQRTGKYVGGGAAIGAIIGAIAGGGKGAAIGAGAGAAAGAGGQVITRGRNLEIPPESVLTFRVEQPLNMGVADNGSMREGWHYHNQRAR